MNPKQEYFADFDTEAIPKPFNEQELQVGAIRLKHKFNQPDKIKQYVPSYHFDIIKNNDTHVGMLSLRVAHCPALFHCGHIGYEIYEPYRGNRLATQATKLALELLEKYYALSPVIITCSPDNIASKKTILACDGFVFLGQYAIPSEHEMYSTGRREVLVFMKRSILPGGVYSEFVRPTLLK
jgi:RimJ/RimL family protein N-acetyltransferase